METCHTWVEGLPLQDTVSPIQTPLTVSGHALLGIPIPSATPGCYDLPITVAKGISRETDRPTAEHRSVMPSPSHRLSPEFMATVSCAARRRHRSAPTYLPVREAARHLHGETRMMEEMIYARNFVLYTTRGSTSTWVAAPCKRVLTGVTLMRFTSWSHFLFAFTTQDVTGCPSPRPSQS